jgi:hypothetical protein
MSPTALIWILGAIINALIFGVPVDWMDQSTILLIVFTCGVMTGRSQQRAGK